MLEQIIDIVRRAGDIVLSAHDIQNVTREKHGPADLVTQYDEAVQVFLRQELLKLLPEAEFFGEEGSSRSDPPLDFCGGPHRRHHQFHPPHELQQRVRGPGPQRAGGVRRGV